MIAINFKSKRLRILKDIFSKPLYLAILVVAGFLYYFLLYTIIKMSSFHGIIILTAPLYMFYLLVATSAVLITISIYGIRKRIAIKDATAGGVVSVVMPSVGGLVAGCGCSAPLLSSLLIPVLGSIGAESFISYLSAYNIYIFGVLVLINLIIIYYQLNLLSK